MNFEDYAHTSISDRPLQMNDCLQILHSVDDDLLDLINVAYKVRRKYFGNHVQVQILTNAKSGRCPEDCHYCSQSSISTAEIEKYSMLSAEKLIEEARSAKELKAMRYCMALSGRKPNDREIEKLCEIIAQIKKETGLSVCCSLGLVTSEQAQRLKVAGLDRINHNLNTSRNYHPQICTTHSYQDRLDTISRCKEAGLEICSGGIVGQGESDEDIIDLLFSLREIDAESVPINFLIPISGTMFENRTRELTPRRCLKILCLARFLLPNKEIRVAGGREHHLRHLQPLALYVANSIFVNGYLTTGGQDAVEAIRMIEDMGFTAEIEGAVESSEAPSLLKR